MVAMWTGLAVIGLVIALVLVARAVNMGTVRPRLRAEDRRPDPPIGPGGPEGPLVG